MENQGNWGENKLIGEQAESVVKFLIESIPGWKCIPYGIENHINELKNLLKENLNETSKRIRSMPDFIAVNQETNEIFLIDVKYRSFVDRRNPYETLYGFGYGNIRDYLDFWKDMKLLIVHNHEPYFIVVNIKDIEWHKHFHNRQYRSSDGKMFEQWNFREIEKGIKDLFPDISEEIINSAISRIPSR